MKYKNVLVVGMGKSGMAALDCMFEMGVEVSVYDKKKESDISKEFVEFLKEKNIKYYFGENPSRDCLENADLLIMSPGIPRDTDFVIQAENAGADIKGELEMAYELGKGEYIAITGTNGKTTTTTLVGEIIRKSGRKTVVAGNIGLPVITEAVRADDDTVLVTEVSSFQLETIDKFKPAVSAILNITPDHIDRHKTFENYAETKGRIFENQVCEDVCVINMDDQEALRLAENARCKVAFFSRKEKVETGAYVDKGRIYVADSNQKVDVMPLEEIKIPGEHNIENVLAAVAICYFYGIDVKEIRQHVSAFYGVEHRIEIFERKNGIVYVNDSKGTNTDAAVKAIEALKENIILIAGGYDKGADFTDFIKAFNGRVKHMLVLGQTKEKIADAANKCGFRDFTTVQNMEEAVELSKKIAVSGDSVLLSPACASWDMYKSFEERGKHFKQCVKNQID